MATTAIRTECERNTELVPVSSSKRRHWPKVRFASRLTPPELVAQTHSNARPTDTSATTSGLVIDTRSMHKISLEPLNCSFGIVRTTKINEKSFVCLKEVVQRQRQAIGADVTIVYAVRTPGCAICRENAVHISNWASSLNSSSSSRPKVSLVGIVKESGTPETDEAVLNFYESYFTHPLYRDSKWDIYKAMGGRNVSVWSLLSRGNSLLKRARSKKIENKPTGEVWMLGGLLVLDKQGEIRHVMLDRFGHLFDTQALDTVVREIRRGGSQVSQSAKSSDKTCSIGTAASDRSE
jgi:AhpC/TSA antioxidant enzyme